MADKKEKNIADEKTVNEGAKASKDAAESKESQDDMKTQKEADVKPDDEPEDEKKGDEKTEDVKSEEENPTEEESGEEPKMRKSSRKEKKEKKDKKDIKIEELNDRLMRLMAEYDNYRKRTDREKSAMYEMGVSSVVEKIIPVVDNFERGFDSISDAEKENPFVQGMDKIYSQFIATLEGMGVKPIEAVGKEFDPNIHNAVMHVEDETLGENIVVEEFQKGYMYKENVVRCSMVKVAN